MDLSSTQHVPSSNGAWTDRALPRVAAAGVLGIAVAFLIVFTQVSPPLDRTRVAGVSTPLPGKHPTEPADTAMRPAVRPETRRASTIEATIARLGELGMRNFVVCVPSRRGTSWGPTNDINAPRSASVSQLVCDGATSHVEATAASIAAGDAQAVVFEGSTSDARTFIEALRARGSFAMVVLTSAVDAKRLAKTLSPDAATWLAVVEPIPSSASPQRDAQGVRLGVLARNGVILY
jgi:hypothetical protein